MNKMMTKASLLTIAFIVFIPFGLQAQDEGFYPYSYARLSYVNGSVYVQRTSDLGYEKGEVNLALVQGDKMGTENGQAEIHFGRRNYLRLDDNTKVEFAVLPTEGDERIKIHLTEGSAYFRVSHLALDKGVEIHTPDASFYVLEEGLYRFDVGLDRDTRVFVREGSLEAAAEEGSVLVRGQETVTAADGRLLGDPEYAYSREDGFDDWNGSRDAQLSQRSERQYLPSELEEYEEELDQNGHWVYERPYGNVWVPNVYYDDWRPYSFGRWVWYPIIGWTWVSSESWGWPVYHYGRWHWRFGLGWYWIPWRHWGPAWVHWWWDRDYIGWCPLSWHNRPVLIINNNFYDRHYDRYFSAHNRAMTIIRRDHLQSRDIGRRRVGAGELDRIGRVDLKAGQPSIRPVVDSARPQALEAKRALAVRPGSRSEVKSLAPSRSLSSSRLRKGGVDPGARPSDRRGVSSPTGSRDAVSRPDIRSSGTGSRTIRSFPSQRLSGSRDEGGAAGSPRHAVASPDRRSAAEAGATGARVSRSQGQISGYPRSSATREPQITRRPENESGSAVTGKGGAVREYPTAARSGSTAVRERSAASSRTIRSGSDRSSDPSSGRSQSRTYSSRSSVSRSPSRLRAPSASASRSSSAISRPSSSARPGSRSYSPSVSSRSRSSYSSPSRPASPSYSRPGSARSASSSRSRSTYSSPSPRSSGSSGRSYSSPRSSGSSSGRSYSAPRSSGSSSSGRAKSSGSSSKTGGAKRKS